MLDIRYIRENVGDLKAKLKHKKFEFDVEKFIELDRQRKDLQVIVENLQNLRKTQAKRHAEQKRQGVSSVQDTSNEISSNDLKTKEVELKVLMEELQEFMQAIPNVPDESVPIGTSEKDNQVLRTWGEIKPTKSALDHLSLGEKAKGILFEEASLLSGARFVILKGQFARLHRALGQFMLDFQTDTNAYEEYYHPYLVNTETLTRTGHLPKFAADLFKISDHDLWLIPTAEVPLTSLINQKIFLEQDLPLKYVSLSPAFRSEAGSYGKDTKGMIRQHQFDKVELVQIVHPSKSYEALEEITQHAESILQALELPYRVVSLCRGDLGFSAAKTYDLEVWLPGQNLYREISSCSNVESFQALRMGARFRNQNKKMQAVHTLNGSGLAVGRAMVAVLENYQIDANSIAVPKVLQPYMQGLTKITW